MTRLDRAIAAFRLALVMAMACIALTLVVASLAAAVLR